MFKVTHLDSKVFIKKRMKKITKPTESDLNRIAKRVVSEQSLPSGKNFKQLANMLEKAMTGGGTDLDKIKLVFDQIKNKQEYMELKKAFGMREGQDLETWIGRDIWSGNDWDTYVKPFFNKIGVKVSPVNSEIQNVVNKITSVFNESNLKQTIKRVVNEQEKDTMIKKLMRKLKGVSDKQLEYNIEHNLPWDWRGSKEGYYEKMEPRKNNSGSN